MKIVELCVIIGYLILMLMIGFYFRRRAQSSASGFWSADANIGWYINAFAVLATIMSGGGMLGNIGAAASVGCCYVGFSTWGTCTGIGMAATLVAQPLRRSKAKTLSDFIHIRYDSKKVGFMVAIVIIAAYTVYLMSQMKAAGTLGQYIIGLDYNTSVVVTWVVFTLYTMLGGMLAVTWTDFLQGVLMMFAVVACAIVALVQFGGLSNIYAQAIQAFPNFGILHLPFISYLGFFCVWFFVNMCGPTVLMRVATAKSPFSAGLSMHTAMLLLSIFTATTLFVIAPAARALAGPGTLENQDAYFLIFLEQSFGPVMKGVIGAAIFAAIMSTASGLLLAAAAALSNDIVTKLKKFTPKGESRAALVCCLAISVLVLANSFNPPDLLVVLYSQAMNFLMCCLFVPFMAGLWWKRATAAGAATAIICGAIPYIVVVFFMSLPTFSETFIALPCSLIGMIVGSLATKPQSDDKILQVESWHLPETVEINA